VFCKKLDNLKNKPAGMLQKFYAQMPTLPASDDITRFDGKEEVYNKVRNHPLYHPTPLSPPKKYFPPPRIR
jgi:hypothetical protein